MISAKQWLPFLFLILNCLFLLFLKEKARSSSGLFLQAESNGAWVPFIFQGLHIISIFGLVLKAILPSFWLLECTLSLFLFDLWIQQLLGSSSSINLFQIVLILRPVKRCLVCDWGYGTVLRIPEYLILTNANAMSGRVRYAFLFALVVVVVNCTSLPNAFHFVIILWTICTLMMVMMALIIIKMVWIEVERGLWWTRALFLDCFSPLVSGQVSLLSEIGRP